MLVILLENHSRSEVLAQMPHLASWARRYGQATHYYAVAHPSLPNYLAIWGGSTFGVTSNCAVGSSGCVPAAPSIFGQTVAAGRTVRAYQETMSTDCQIAPTGTYAPRHGPWPYWTNAAERRACRSSEVPSGTPSQGPLERDVSAGHLPVTGEFTPDLCHDAHDCSMRTADRWLAQWIRLMTAGPDFRQERLTMVITFDEDDASSRNKVPFVVIDPRLHGKTVSARITHYALARWLEDNAGVARLRRAARARSLRTAFGL